MLPSARYSPGPFLAMAWLTTFVETASLTILATGADPSRKRSQIGGRASPPHRANRPASGSLSSRRIEALPGSAQGLQAEAVPCPRSAGTRSSRLGCQRWPPDPQGDRRERAGPASSWVFDSAGEARRVDGIGADPAVPRAWPPVTIGIAASYTAVCAPWPNADLAAGVYRGASGKGHLPVARPSMITPRPRDVRGVIIGCWLSVATRPGS